MKKSVLCISIGLLVGLVGCAQQPTADDIVMKVTAAIGGAEKLDSITDQVSDWNFTMYQVPMPEEPDAEGTEHEAGPMSMPMKITYKRPNKLRFDFLAANGEVVQSSCYDGQTGWTAYQGQKMAKSAAELRQDAEMAANWVDGFLHYEEKGYSLDLMANENTASQEAIVLKTTDKGGHSMIYYIDPETHFVTRQEGDMVNFQGELEPMYLTFSDYQMVDGIAMAHHVAEFSADDEMIWEASLKSVAHNVGVTDEAFMAEPMMTAK